MFRLHVMLSILLLFVVAIAVAADDQTAPLPPKVKPAHTPEEAVQRLEASIRTGDLDAYSALLPRVQRERWLKQLAAIRASEKATDAFNDALEARFGKAARLPRVEKLDFKKILTDRAAKLVIVLKAWKEAESKSRKPND